MARSCSLKVGDCWWGIAEVTSLLLLLQSGWIMEEQVSVPCRGSVRPKVLLEESPWGIELFAGSPKTAAVLPLCYLSHPSNPDHEDVFNPWTCWLTLCDEWCCFIKGHKLEFNSKQYGSEYCINTGSSLVLALCGYIIISVVGMTLKKQSYH